MHPPVQCKDIPDKPILAFLKDHSPQWCNWYFQDDRCVTRAMPTGTKPKLVLAKMRMMIRRGVVDGCPCGCRGDYVITDKGREELAK